MPIKYPIKPTGGAKVDSFPKVQQEKIIEIIDAINNNPGGGGGVTGYFAGQALGFIEEVASLSKLSFTVDPAVTPVGISVSGTDITVEKAGRYKVEVTLNVNNNQTLFS